MQNFSGKLVFITGGSSGIGFETARILASSGARVAIFGRDILKLQRAQDTISKTPGVLDRAAYSLAMDVSDPVDVRQKIKKAVEECGIPDILINSAGIGHSDLFENIESETFDAVIRTNLYGTWHVIASMLPYLKENGGHIVNVSSMLGLIGLFGYCAYGASKFALVGLSECLRCDLKRFNIHVSVYCPPEVDTPMTDLMCATSPAPTRELVKITGLLTATRAAEILLEGIAKKRFLIVAGYRAKASYAFKRLFPGLSRLMIDITVERALRKIGG